jgi:dynein light chain roadblock-type
MTTEITQQSSSADEQATSAPSHSSSQNTGTTSSSNVNLQELNETVSRLSAHKGVEMVQILNRNGDIIVGDSENGGGGSSEAQQQHAASTQKLIRTAATYLQQLDPDDEISFLQLRSKGGRELMISPHQGYALVVLKLS